MKKYPIRFVNLTLALGLGALSLSAQPSAGQVQGCFGLPGHAALQSAITTATAAEASGCSVAAIPCCAITGERVAQVSPE